MKFAFLLIAVFCLSSALVSQVNAQESPTYNVYYSQGLQELITAKDARRAAIGRSLSDLNVLNSRLNDCLSNFSSKHSYFREYREAIANDKTVTDSLVATGLSNEMIEKMIGRIAEDIGTQSCVYSYTFRQTAPRIDSTGGLQVLGDGFYLKLNLKAD